jgi:hypothetical protein
VSSEPKFDTEKAWVRAKLIVPVVAATGALVALYMRFEFRMTGIEAAMSRDISARTEERREQRESMDGLRADLRKVFVDAVATRQATTWIEMFRALNRDKYPNLLVPDLPR